MSMVWEQNKWVFKRLLKKYSLMSSRSELCESSFWALLLEKGAGRGGCNLPAIFVKNPV